MNYSKHPRIVVTWDRTAYVARVDGREIGAYSNWRDAELAALAIVRRRPDTCDCGRINCTFPNCNP